MIARARFVKRLTVKEISAELAEVARAGSIFVDGELVKEAYMPYARAFTCGDDMDFNPVATVPLKKTLMRLELLSRVPCATTVWRRRPDDPKSGEALLSGFASSPQAGDKPANRGYKFPPMSRELAEVFLHGRQCVVKVDRKVERAVLTMRTRGRSVPAKGLKGSAMVQVYSPIKDSLGEVVGVLEVFAAAVGG
jgi:hypothetical protein